MSKATHFNEINNSHYMKYKGTVSLWNGKTWVYSNFKVDDITLENGFKEI